MKSFAFGDHNKAARQTIVERLAGMCAGRQWRIRPAGKKQQDSVPYSEKNDYLNALYHIFFLTTTTRGILMRPEFSANPLGTCQDNRLPVGPARPSGRIRLEGMCVNGCQADCPSRGLCRGTRVNKD